ncbi:Gfo/Idh/MocA family oxidoreductase [Actinopolymorpha sp. B17G11]|uniref:Gfo/Idh/MocA family protein n=1 Tax=Actinopolymorpha sp. B17G11 TaxID=3160861 RepID=UPI0032E5237C
MATTPVRVGIVGATVTTGGSGWGANAHVPALQALPEFELKAVCTSREGTARASAQAFGAELAFHDIDEMVAHPDVDLVAVVVRVPWHRDLVMAGLRAGKPVFCEWPLGANLTEAQEMADAARERSLRTMVGLQARSDSHVRYARDLIADGYVGEVLVANVTVKPQAITERGTGRIWQADLANGANPLTIPGGHTIDALCFLLGEFAEVSARVATRIRHWRHTDTGEEVRVTAPDSISVAGRLVGDAEVAFQVATVPTNPTGTRIEIHGSEGSLVLTGPSAQIGPNQLVGARGSDPMTELTPPARYTPIPGDTPAGSPWNVAQAYHRIAHALRDGEPYDPDFAQALRRHRLIEAIGRSSQERRAVAL